MAGSKKHKWSLVSKTMKGYFGKSGFTGPGKRANVVSRPVNVGYICENLHRFAQSGKASHSGPYSIDLVKAGYTKLLGTGKVTKKLKLKVDACSAKARKKVEEAGGSVETAEKATGSTGG